MEKRNFIKNRSIFLVLLISLITGVILWQRWHTTLSPNDINAGTTHETQVTAWFPDYDFDRALISLNEAPLYQVSPFWYQMDESGDLELLGEEYKTKVLATSKARNIRVIPSILNGFEGERTHTFLVNKKGWKEFADKLLRIARDDEIQGFDLDWEELLSSDRDRYTEFVAFLAEEMHNNDLVLSVTVHAQTGDPDPRDAEVAQDLQSLAVHADEIRIMAYDFHHSESEAGPITPLRDLEHVLQETKKLVPAEKVVIALPTYGYDWVSNKGEEMQYTDALIKLDEMNSTYSLDAKDQALTATYTLDGEKHTVWFEDSNTLRTKINLVKKYGFYKIALWRLGGEDPTTWDLF